MRMDLRRSTAVFLRVFTLGLLILALWVMVLARSTWSPEDGMPFYDWRLRWLAWLLNWHLVWVAYLCGVLYGSTWLSVKLNPDESSASVEVQIRSVLVLLLQWVGLVVIGLSLYWGIGQGERLGRYLLQSDRPTAQSWILWGLVWGPFAAAAAAGVLLAFHGYLATLVTPQTDSHLGEGSTAEFRPTDPGLTFLGAFLLMVALLCGATVGVETLRPRLLAAPQAPVFSPAELVAAKAEHAVGASKAVPGSVDLNIQPAVVLETAGPLPRAKGALEEPRGVAVSPDQRLYVCDMKKGRVVVFSPGGKFLFSFGKPSLKGRPAGPGELSEPTGIAFGRDGVVYVADNWNARIQKFSGDGRYLGEIGGDKLDFFSPRNIVVDDAGMLYVADTGHSVVKVIDPQGQIRQQLGGPGTWRGQMDEVFGLALTRHNQLLVADPGNRMIHKYSAYPQMALMKEAKVPGWDLDRPAWPFLASDGTGHIYVTDMQKKRLWVYDEDLKYLGCIDTGKVDPPIAPVCVALDAQRNLWVSDTVHPLVHKIAAVPLQKDPVDVDWKSGEFYFPRGSSVKLLNYQAPAAGLADDFVERAQFIEQHDHMVQEERFDELETEAAQFRATGAVFANGDSKLYTYYMSVATGCGYYSDGLSEGRFEGFLAKTDKWLLKSPNSATARLLKAELLIDYAWQARGSGTGDRVKPNGWKPFGERLEQAWAALDELDKDPVALADPLYYVMRLHAGYGLSKGPDELAAWYEKGRKACPGIWEIAFFYAQGIAYKWGGGDRLPIFYARLLQEDPVAALYVAAYDADNSFGAELPDGGGPWDKFMPDRESFWKALAGPAKTALSRYPQSAITAARVGRVAADSGHYLEANPLLQAEGDRFEAMSWRDGDIYFLTKMHCADAAAGLVK